MRNQTVQNGTTYNWEWPAVMGVFLVVLGAAVIAIPTVATIGISWLMGLALLLSGFAQLIHAFRFAKSHGSAGRFLLALLSMVAGVVTLRNPLAGAVGITLVLAFYLLFGGTARMVLAIEAAKAPGRGWLMFSSIVSFFLGGYLLATIPVSSWVIPGTLLGIDFIFFGVALVASSSSFYRGKSSLESTDLRKAS